ncbi:MAG: hypothetical protein ACRDTF_10420 [Pseudonocardiaceae bacterium]
MRLESKENDLRNDRKQKAISEDTAQVEFCLASTVLTELPGMLKMDRPFVGALVVPSCDD